MLCLFAARQGQIVTRREIMDAVWPDVVVEENNISVQLASLRRVLDEGRTEGSFIQTVSGRGYRFLPRIEPSPDPAIEPVSQARPDDAPAPISPRRRIRLVWFAAVFGGIAASAIVHNATLPSRPEPPPAPIAGSASASSVPSAVSPASKPRLSVAILPFTRSGAHASAAAEAIAETLTTDLTQLGAGALSVIGRGATLQYRDNPTDIRRIGDDLSVRYAIEGDVRGDDDGRLVIQGRLVSTHTGTQLWAERFETTRDAHAGVLDATARQIAFVVYSRTVEEESRLVTRDQAGNATAEDVRDACPEPTARVRRRQRCRTPSARHRRSGQGYTLL
jgi:TolB-like protein